MQTVRYDNDDDINWLFDVNICDNICDDAVNVANCCANVTDDVRRLETALETTAPICLSSMQYKMIMVDELGVNNYRALVDSGAELCVMRDELIVGRDVTPLGKINLRGVVGDSVPAELAELHVKPSVQICDSELSDDLEETLENTGQRGQRKFLF